MKLDYNLIKKCIVKACKQEGVNTLNFKIDYQKLNGSVAEYGLVFLNNAFLTSRAYHHKIMIKIQHCSVQSSPCKECAVSMVFESPKAKE